MPRKKSTNESLYYVAPGGDDSWSGRLPVPAANGNDGPFATPARACQAIREVRQAAPGTRIRVLLRSGVYCLKETLTFSPAESGTEDAPVVFAAYPGEAPVLSGGRRIRDWTHGSINGIPCWVAELADVRDGHWQFTQLFVDGVRRPRSRLPRTGYYHFSGLPEGLPMAATPWMQGPDRALFRPGEIQAWKNIADVKLVALQLWFEAHHRIKALDLKQNLVVFRAKSLGSLRDERHDMARYYLENVAEAASEPGDWYLERPTGRLHYIPRPGEDMATTEVRAPRLERIVCFAGTDAAPVQHVRLENLALQHAEWDYPVDDPGSIQAAFKVPGAVVFDRAEHCVIYGCTVSHVAQYGVEIQSGSHGNQVVACAISDMGAGGVRINHESMERVNETSVTAEAARANVKPMETTVSDCEIHDGSHLHLSAIGIWVGNSGRNRLLHNHIYNLNYTGISCGWTWGYAPTRTVDNRIEYNHIHHINHQRILSDNGGIYTLGIQPGTTLRGNHIHDIACYGYGGWGIYPDEGSSEMRIEDNVVHHTLYAGFSTHYGRDNVVRNNIFALAADAQVGAGKREGHRTTIFEQNIVYWRDGQWRAQDLVPGSFTFRRNLLWNARTGSVDLGLGATAEDWQRQGQHLETVTADPLFADPEAGNFALREDSPALKLGFKPVDPSLAGPRCLDRRPASFDDWPGGQATEKEIVRTHLTLTAPDQLEVTVENVGTLTASGSLRFKGWPAGQVKVARGAEFAFRRLAPGARASQTVAVQIPDEVGVFYLETVPDGEGLVPALLLVRRRPVWKMARLAAAPDVAAVAAALAKADAVVLQRFSETMAEARAGVGGEQLLLQVKVSDRGPAQREAPWEGSCIELFVAPEAAADEDQPGAAKPGVVQLILVPPADGQPPRLLRQDAARGPVPAPEIKGVCERCPEGYEIQALLPLKLLRLPAAVKAFRIEMAVSLRRKVDGPFVRATLHEAPAAYASPDGYGPALVAD